MFESSVGKRFAEHTNLMREMREREQPGSSPNLKAARAGYLGSAGSVQSAGRARLHNRGMIFSP